MIARPATRDNAYRRSPASWIMSASTIARSAEVLLSRSADWPFVPADADGTEAASPAASFVPGPAPLLRGRSLENSPLSAGSFGKPSAQPATHNARAANTTSLERDIPVLLADPARTAQTARHVPAAGDGFSNGCGP